MDSTCNFHVEIHDDYNTNCQNMRNWIIGQDLRADQIIAISSGLRDLINDAHMLVCFYRSATMANEPPMLL